MAYQCPVCGGVMTDKGAFYICFSCGFEAENLTEDGCLGDVDDDEDMSLMDRTE